MKKLTVVLIALIICVSALSACSRAYKYQGLTMGDGEYDELPYPDFGENIDPEAAKIIENPFVKTSDEPASTFSADVDTASYSFLRHLIRENYDYDQIITLGGSMIRTEELVNYFRYSYKLPEKGELFGVDAKLVTCPWNTDSSLLILGLQTEKPEIKTANNLVFLIDISGSMSSKDKLPLLQKTFSYLTSNLGADDTVSIVTYAAGEKVVLEGCEGNKTVLIQNAIDKLKAGGSTNGEAGLKKAYELAEKYYKPDGNNRIIMASDGDLNVGISSVDEVKKFVSEKRDAGVFLSVLGFGYGNYRDSIMEAVADNGNGAYYYIDCEEEAEKVFGTDLLSTLYTVAKDVKLQVTFDAGTVSEYRLIGYENRLMTQQDFEDDTKDAGELGAGHCVTVCYELKLNTEPEEGADHMFDLSVRYKKPDEDQSLLNEYSFLKSVTAAEADADTDLIAALCETAMILHKSEFGGDLTLKDVLKLLEAHDYSPDGYKEQFVSLISKLDEISEKETATEQ